MDEHLEIAAAAAAILMISRPNDCLIVTVAVQIE
jgi:hypothetical protein